MKIFNFLKFINRKDLILVFLLMLAVTLSQFILAGKNLEMGFFTDDWMFLSAYRASVANPFLDIMQAWKEIHSHNFSYAYYIGILYSFFGLDYSAYRIINLIFKIIATLSLYPLVLYISKRRLLAFLATFIYAIHFSTFGLLDGPSRGGNFIAITLMNLFLLTYFYVSKKKISNILISFSMSVWLLVIILIGSTRLFPLILIVPLVELFNLRDKIREGIKIAIKRLAIVYLPFLLLFIFSPNSIVMQIGYIDGLFAKIRDGNWQLFLTPFAVMGSMFIPKDFWPFFGKAFYENFNSFLSSLLLESILLYSILLLCFVFFISKKPLKFMIRHIIFSFVVGLVVYIIDHNWLFLSETIRTPVDPGIFLIPALIGLYVLITSFCLFIEWKESKEKNKLHPFLFLAPLFSLVFIFLTWIFADINSIFMGVHAYLTIPAMGTSVVFATILVMIYERLKSFKGLGKVAPGLIIIIILFFYFKICATNVDKFFSHWLDDGALISDQQRIMNQFWTEIGDSEKFDQDNLPLIYFDTDKIKYEDGAYYSEVIIWRLPAWFDLRYKNNKEGRFSLCSIEILGKTELEKFVSVGDDGKTLISNKCGRMTYETKNFFAFSLENRNLVPERLKILKSLGVE